MASGNEQIFERLTKIEEDLKRVGNLEKKMQEVLVLLGKIHLKDIDVADTTERSTFSACDSSTLHSLEEHPMSLINEGREIDSMLIYIF